MDPLIYFLHLFVREDMFAGAFDARSHEHRVLVLAKWLEVEIRTFSSYPLQVP
jgi:hypothetical protein